MAKSKVSPKDTPRQEAVPDLVKFTTPLFKLSVLFFENIKSNKNNLHLLSQLMFGAFISGAWNDDLAWSMSNALEKIMEDAADALDDFQDRLKSALRRTCDNLSCVRRYDHSCIGGFFSAVP